MMEHLGEPEAGKRIFDALKTVTGEAKVRTPDLGGSATTRQFADAVIARIAAK